MSLYPNRRPGTCTTCKSKVAAQEGFVSRNKAGGWDCFCNSNQCIPALLQSAHASKDRKELTEDGELYFPYDPEALDLLRSFPPTRDRNKRFWDAQKKCRHVSLQPEDRPRVLELCDRLGVQVAPSLREIPRNESLQEAQERCEALPTLYPYQKEGVEFLAGRRNALLADDMGLGKTVQALLAVSSDSGALVVCPSVVKYNWAAEVRKWRKDLTPKVLEGRGNFEFPKPGEVVITNFEILPKWLMPVTLGKDPQGREIKGALLPDLPSLKVDIKKVTLIVDEAHRTKNYRTMVHKKIQELSTLCGRSWFLTGTPLMNKPTDLYGVLQAGHMAFDVFGGWKGFVRCFNGHRGGFRGAYVWGRPLPEVPERMRRVMLRRHKDDVLTSLPPTIWRDVVVSVNGKRLQKQLDKAYEGVRDTLDTGALPRFEDLSQVRADLAKSRIPALCEMVEDFEDSGEPLVVFSAYKAPVEELGKREGWAMITGDVSPVKRQQIVQDFQAGNLKGIALTIAAGGVGITLTKASNILFVDLDWVPANNAQAVDRIRRIGQNASSVQVIRMVSNHPVDQRVHELLAQKMELINKAIEQKIEYTKKETESVEIRRETEEEWEARKQQIEEAAKELEKEEARKRARDSQWLQGERKKASRPEVPISPKVAVSLRDALSYMLNRCDGAQAKDDAGFNKPDAGRARVLIQTGLTDEEELRAAERMLSRYYRQLHDKYPEIFA